MVLQIPGFLFVSRLPSSIQLQLQVTVRHASLLQQMSRRSVGSSVVHWYPMRPSECRKLMPLVVCEKQTIIVLPCRNISTCSEILIHRSTRYNRSEPRKLLTREARAGQSEEHESIKLQGLPDKPHVRYRIAIENLAEDHGALSVDEWNSHYHELLSYSAATPGLGNNDKAISTQLMKKLHECKNYSRAQSLMTFLRNSKREVHIYTLLNYFHLCCENEQLCTKDDIISVFEQLWMNIHRMADADRVRLQIVRSLCKTSHWERTVEMMEEIKAVMQSRTADAFNCITATAFQKSKTDLGWKLFSEQLIEKDQVPSIDVYEEAMNAILDLQASGFHDNAYTNITYLLQSLTRKKVIPSKCFADSVAEFYKRKQSFPSDDKYPDSNMMYGRQTTTREEKQNWNVRFTRTQGDGICCACKQPLERMSIAPAEYDRLRDALFTDVLKDSNFFVNSTPAEVEQFERFMKQHGPFDIVLDGLNIIYLREQMPVLPLVVMHFQQLGKRILIIGRKHLAKRWLHLNRPKKNVFLFLLDNVSKDDLFLLYATLKSGPNACFVSNDLMHNHGTKLVDRTMQVVYEDWRKMHHVHVLRISKQDMKLVGPQRHKIEVQGDAEHGWHIPYTTDVELGPYDVVDNWLCISRN